MAVLDKIRSHSVLLVVVIGVALAGFVIGDLFTSGRTFWDKSERVALSIDGKDISIEEYSARLEQLQQQAERQGQKMGDEQRMMLNNQLAQQYISEYALTKIADKAGVQVTDDELYALLTGKGISPSPLAVQFFGSADEKQVNEFIRQLSDKQIAAAPADQRDQLKGLQQQFIALQQQVRVQRLQEKIGTLLSRSFKINDLDRELALGGASRSVALVRSAASMITDAAAKPSDEEVQKYYDGHKDFFRMQSPMAEVSYISVQVVPSQADYQAAAEEKAKAVAELRAASTVPAVESALRAYASSNKFFDKSYLTGEELDQLGLGADQVAFVKSAAVGEVSDPQLVNDRYDIVKLVGKKSAPSALGLRMIVLNDSVKGRADSLVAQLGSGASFADLARKYSLDQQSAAQGGLITMPNRMGLVDSTFSEFTLSQLGAQSGLALDTLYKVPVGTVVRLGQAPMTILLRAENAQPAVEKYQLAYVSLEATFSPETYNAKYAAMNKILGAGGGFDAMAQRAQKEGFSVTRGVAVETGSPMLGQIPSSRPIVTWALGAKDGEVSPKLYTCGTDYLVIPAVGKHTPAGFAPLSVVKEQIVAKLMSEKKAEQLVKQLEAKKLSTLEAYAEAMQSKVDTLVDVNYIVRGSEPAAFNGYAMTTALGKLSKPFAGSNSEVFVLQPISATPVDKAASAAALKQQELGQARQYSYQAFADFIQRLKIKDNRARFY